MADFQTVKSYVQELHLVIVHEDPAQHILVVEDDERGINHLVIDCEEPTADLRADDSGRPSQSW